MTASGLDAADQAALEASPAYGALIAQLRRAEAAELNVLTLLRRATNQQSLANAHDPAAVVHHRLTHLIARSLHQSVEQPTLIAGLILPATHVSDPALVAALHELESQITQRTDWLAGQACREQPPWYDELVRGATLPESRLAVLVREIAAYRERYGIHSQSILGETPTQSQATRRTQYLHLLAQLSAASAPNRPVPPADIETAGIVQEEYPHR